MEEETVVLDVFCSVTKANSCNFLQKKTPIKNCPNSLLAPNNEDIRLTCMDEQKILERVREIISCQRSLLFEIFYCLIHKLRQSLIRCWLWGNWFVLGHKLNKYDHVGRYGCHHLKIFDLTNKMWKCLIGKWSCFHTAFSNIKSKLKNPATEKRNGSCRICNEKFSIWNGYVNSRIQKSKYDTNTTIKSNWCGLSSFSMLCKRYPISRT